MVCPCVAASFAMMAICQGMVGSNDRDDEKHTEQVRSLGWMMLDDRWI